MFDVDLILSSNEAISVGDVVWDAVGITPPKFDRPGCPKNIFNALERVGQIDADARHKLQAEAESLPKVEAAMPDVKVIFNAEHAGDFGYPEIVNVATKMSVSKISSFNFADLQARVMTNDMRMVIDRGLDDIKRRDWERYDMTIRRAHVITELIFGSLEVSLDLKVAVEVDVKLLTDLGFKVKGKDATGRIESYSMKSNKAPIAMRTELVRRFAA